MATVNTPDLQVEPMTSAKVEAKGVEAVERALRILESFDVQTPSLTLAELSRRTGFYKSTILRLAVSLERFGYLVRSDDGQFRLGSSNWRLGSCYRQSFDLSNVMRPALKQLSDATAETASYYIREGDRRICLYRSEPARAIRHSLAEAARMPLDKGASGRILLGYSSLAHEHNPELVAQGYAVSMGERDPEVAAIACPIVSQSGAVLGALAVSGLITRFAQERLPELLDALFATQKSLQSQIDL